MKIQVQPMGTHQTNCYIVTIDKKDFIIDPGVDALEWVLGHVKNPVAILNTHGHFDHIWSNSSLQNRLNIALYAPEKDNFMLQNDPFEMGTPPSTADGVYMPNETLNIEGVNITFHHYPGHTPGSTIIEIADTLFSGDVVFKGSIGRYDFPYSNSEDMRKSLEKFLKLEREQKVYPGHGPSTTVKSEQKNIPMWFKYL